MKGASSLGKVVYEKEGGSIYTSFSSLVKALWTNVNLSGGWEQSSPSELHCLQQAVYASCAYMNVCVCVVCVCGGVERWWW